MPAMSLPRPRLPWRREPVVEDTRNEWVGNSLDMERPSPLQVARNGARRVADSTRSAWHKTVDVLTPGMPAPENSNLARSEPRPSLWKRMFGAEEPEPQGPRTVNEMLSQERLDF
jgi:hypothetical protein